MYVFVHISDIDVEFYGHGENMKDTHWIIIADCVGRQGWVGGAGADAKGNRERKNS